MVLDATELLMRIEETFGIAIPDRDAERLNTVGEVYCYLLDRLEFFQSSGCLTAKIFYRFRRVLVDELGVPREWVRPTTPLDELIPRNRRRTRWNGIASRLRLELPRLKRPRWVVRSMAMLVLRIATGILGVAFTAMGFGLDFVQFAFVFVVCGFPLLIFLGVAATEPLAVQFAAEAHTVGAAVSVIARHNYGWTGPITQTRAPDEIWETLRHLIAEAAGVHPDAISEEMHFSLDPD